jgi:hypothetical protein
MTAAGAIYGLLGGMGLAIFALSVWMVVRDDDPPFDGRVVALPDNSPAGTSDKDRLEKDRPKTDIGFDKPASRTSDDPTPVLTHEEQRKLNFEARMKRLRKRADPRFRIQ